MGTFEHVVLWIGCAGMAAGLLAFSYLRFSKASAASRGFYDKSIAIVLVAALSYLAMAMGQGVLHVAGGRDLLIPRFIDWMITTPLLLLDLILLAKPLLAKGWQWDAATVLLFDVAMIATGLFAALSPAPERWVWFWVSTFAFVIVGLRVYDLFARSSHIPDREVAAKLRLLTAYLGALWLVYPVLFALYFGGAIDSAANDVGNMILDLLAKVGFGLLLLSGAAVEKVDELPSVADLERTSFSARSASTQRSARGSAKT